MAALVYRMPTIAILDDDPDRIRRMGEVVKSRFTNYAVATFDSAPDMIAWLRANLATASLICLDHDLGPNRVRDGETFDPGTGRDVADFLAGQEPVCLVMIHTTNSLAAPGMQMVLEDAGWPFSRVVPFNDLEWIATEWIDAVALALRSTE